jgi:hypothetical protein
MEKLEDLKLREAIQKLPELWQSIKDKAETTSVAYTLNYNGVYEGQILSIVVFKLKIGSIFDVHCIWGDLNLSVFLKSHLIDISGKRG